MPNKKKRRRNVSTTKSNRPTKRRRISHTNKLRTIGTRRSRRLQMKTQQTANNTNSTTHSSHNNTNNDHTNIIENQPLRRSARIKQKMDRTISEQKEQKEQSMETNDNNNDSDMNDIADNMRDNLSVSPQITNTNAKKIYKPISTSKTSNFNFNIPNNYISLRNRMEIGLITAYDFRKIMLENELNNFWNFKRYEYSFQSILPIFQNTNSTDKKINAFTLHDNELFAFSGSKDGYIGVTNFTKIPYQTNAIRCHKGKISDIHTTAKRSLHLYTSSHDGTVKILDLTRVPTWQLNEENNNSYFGDSVIDNDNVMIHGFDIKNSGREIYGVDFDGVVHYCDVRTHSNYTYQIAEKKIATIRIHPLCDHYFVIAENKYKSIQLLDFRMIKNNKMSCIHSRKFTNVCVTLNWSANGQRLLSCGRDPYIRVYDNPLHTFNKDVISMPHKNNTGIWICDFQPIFHPKYNEIVLTGNLDKKGIDLLYFGKDHKKKSYNIHDLTQVKSVHSFGAVHPRINDYLFGVTYEKLVFYANIPSDEQI